MSSSSKNITSFLVPTAETYLSRQIKFAILLTLQIPSVICSLFVLYHLVIDRTNRQALHNHVIIAVLIIGLMTTSIDLPMALSYLSTGVFIPRTSAGCLIWNFIDTLLYGLISLVMLWASIERHILIFHDRLVNTSRRRRFVHYAPLIIIPSYLTIFYAVIILFNPCENVYDYTKILCGATCFYTANTDLAIFDQLAHSTIPAILIVFFNVGIMIRIVWQKHYRMRQHVGGGRHRKMIAQLLPISVLYLCGVIPYGLLNCVHMFGICSDEGQDLQLHFFYLFYLMAVLLPFMCLLGMPNLHRKLPCNKRQTQVAPSLITVNHQLRSRR